MVTVLSVSSLAVPSSGRKSFTGSITNSAVFARWKVLPPSPCTR